MPFRQIVEVRRQEIEGSLDLGSDLRAGQHARPARGDLDPQWQAGDELADPSYRRRILGREREARHQRSGRSDEEVDRTEPLSAVTRLRLDVLGYGEPGQIDDPLTSDVEPLARGRKKFERGRR